MSWMFGTRLAVLGLSAAPLAAQATPSISAEAIGRHISRLAHDSMRGRATPSRELDRAARYAAGVFRSAGLVPLGDSGTYLQRYRILTTRIVPESSSVRLIGPPLPSGSRPTPRSDTWRLGRDVDWVPFGEVSRGVISGPALILTGLPDSARPFGALETRGAVVIHLAQMTETGAPDVPSWLLAAGARAGVAAWIQVVQRDSARWAVVPTRIRQRRTFVSGGREIAGFPIVEMQDETVSGALLAAGVPHAGARPFPTPPPRARLLPGHTVRLRLVERVLTRRTAPNVVGLLPGTDTAGRGTLLVLAHLDGLGIGAPVGSGTDSIYNGADDNVSGVAAVLEAATALARGPRPPRDIVFALFSGTERQLAGAGFYLAHPLVPTAELTGVINVEAIGRQHKDSLVVIRGPDPTPLEAAVERTARTHAAALGLTVVGDLHPRARLWLEGDHSLFFGLGLPILYLYNGPHPDLHKPGDAPGKVDVSQTARIARFLALLAHAAATPPP